MIQVVDDTPDSAEVRSDATTAGSNWTPYDSPTATPASSQPPMSRNGSGIIPRPNTPSVRPRNGGSTDRSNEEPGHHAVEQPTR